MIKTHQNTDYYQEELSLILNEDQEFIEVPEGVEIDYLGSRYAITFEKISQNEIMVKRSYSANRRTLEPEEFSGFKDFMTKIDEAENTHLLFK